MELVLLNCPHCDRPLTPENDDVVVACNNCLNPVAIGVDGPSRISVHFAIQDEDQAAAESWLPFWVFSGNVRINRRETQGGGRSGGRDSAALWGSPRRLYVPAWDLSMRTAQEIGGRLAQQQPSFREIERPVEAKLAAAIVTPGDAHRLLEFIILAIEARRDDWLKDLDFTIEAGRPSLWALPELLFMRMLGYTGPGRTG